jgi:hypothetical protein
MKNPKCCKTCIYARWWLTARGNIHRHSSGRCLYVVPMPVIPESVRTPPNFYTTGIAPDDGAACPCYERNEGPPISETNNE